jgi:hypothetical protein
VTWTVASGRLCFEWTETGGPPPPAPTRTGFGSKLLRSGVQQFHGTCDCRFEPGGPAPKPAAVETLLARFSEQSSAPVCPDENAVKDCR